MDDCINKGAEQHQDSEKDVKCFSKTDVNLKSDIFLWILLFLKSRKYDS